MQRRIAQIVTTFKAQGTAAFNKALQGIANGIRALGPAARAAAGQLGRITLAAGAAAAAIAAIGKASLIAFAHSSIEDTLEDLRAIRQTAAYLRTSIPKASFFQNLGRMSGIDPEGTRDILAAFNTAISEAAYDAESDFAKNFQRVGLKVQVKSGLDPETAESVKRLRQEMEDAGAPAQDINRAVGEMTRQMTTFKGTTSDVTSLFIELAQRVQGMESRDRSFFLASIFGDGDALVVSEMLDRIGRDQTGIYRMMAAQERTSQIVTKKATDLAARIDSARGALTMAWLSTKRGVFVQIAPLYIRLLERLAVFLVQYGSTLSDFVSRSLLRSYALVHDVLKVFTGFDLNKFLLAPSGDVENTWLYDVKDVLDQIVAVAKQTPAFFRDLGRAGVVAFSSAQDKIAEALRGVETQLGARTIDLVFAIQNATEGVRTSLRQVWAEALADFKKVFVNPLVGAWSEAQSAFAAGAGFGDLGVGLSGIMLTLIQIVDWVQRFGQAIDIVFHRGQDAPEGFRWLQDVRDALGSVLGYLADASRAFESLVGGINRVLEGFGLLRIQSLIIFAVMIKALWGLINLMTGGLAGLALGAVKNSLRGLLVAFAGSSGLTAAMATFQTAAVGAATAAGAAFAALAAQIAIVMAGLGAGAAIGWYGADALLGKRLAAGNDERTGRFVDETVRPSMDRLFDLQGGKKPGVVGAAQPAQPGVAPGFGADTSIRLGASGPSFGGNALQEFQVRQADLDVDRLTAEALALETQNTTITSSLRPLNVYLPGADQPIRAYGDQDTVAQIQRSANSALGPL